MGSVIGDILPLAVGVAVSPVPIIAVILMLFSDRARANSLAFLFGWIAGIAAGCAIVIGIAGTQDLTSGGEPSTLASWIKIVFGVLLLLVAARQWRSRPVPGGEAAMPAWMQKTDTLKPAGALGLAVLLAVLNPKNLLLILGAGVSIAQGELSGSQNVVAVVVFTILGACTVAIPTVAYLAVGARAQPALDGMKSWLSVNTTAVMAVLMLVIGVTLFGKGLGGLL
jgi:threonine/homoserine/homoserine lactone efflux protein